MAQRQRVPFTTPRKLPPLSAEIAAEVAPKTGKRKFQTTPRKLPPRGRESGIVREEKEEITLNTMLVVCSNPFAVSALADRVGPNDYAKGITSVLALLTAYYELVHERQKAPAVWDVDFISGFQLVGERALQLGAKESGENVLENPKIYQKEAHPFAENPNIKIGKVRRGNFPQNQPHGKKYAVLWFAGCSIFHWLEKGIGMLADFLIPGGIVIFTGHAGMKRNKFPFPFVTVEDYAHDNLVLPPDEKVLAFFQTNFPVVPGYPFYRMK